MATRQSARIKSKNTGGDSAIGKNLTSATLSSDNGSSSITKPQARGRKRKEPEEKSGPVRSAKRARTRGLLQRVLEMPYDLLVEIFGHLEPIDLLNIGRTSKDLRKFIMSRSSRNIWRQTMANAREMVECPSHIPEPKWINFLFGKGCTECGKNVQGLQILERSYRRICGKCIKETFIEIEHVAQFANSRVYPVHVACHNVILALTNSRISTWYVEPTRHERWTREYQQLTTDEAKAEWAEQIRTEELKHAETAAACEQLWVNEAMRLERERQAIIKERQKQVEYHMRKMGWGEEIDKMPAGKKYYHVPFIRDACQKNVTARVLSNLEPRIKNLMEFVKEQRLARERVECLRKRMQAFDSRAKKALAGLSRREPQPQTRDLYEDQRIKDLVLKTPIEEQIVESSFDFIDELLPEMVQQWRARAAAQLVAKINEFADEDVSADPITLLSLATSVFSCPRRPTCSNTGFNLWFDDALTHACCTPAISGYRADTMDDPSHLFFTNQPWSARLSFYETDRDTVAKVVQLCDLDPSTTTIEQMNQLDPVFECTRCRDPYTARQVMTWQGVLQHTRNHGYVIDGEDLGMVILEGGEAEEAKKRIAEALERRIYALGLKVICLHCSYSGKMVSMKRHIMMHHNVSEPVTGKDLALGKENINVYQSFAVELWPPYLSESDLEDTDESEDEDDDEDDEDGFYNHMCSCGLCYAEDDDEDEDEDEDEDIVDYFGF